MQQFPRMPARSVSIACDRSKAEIRVQKMYSGSTSGIQAAALAGASSREWLLLILYLILTAKHQQTPPAAPAGAIVLVEIVMRS